MTQDPPAGLPDRECRDYRRSAIRNLAAPCLGMLLPAVVAGLVWLNAGIAADVTETAGFQPHTFAIIHARVVPAPGEVIEDGSVVIRNGLIEGVGREIPIPADADVIDATGLTVYAGFIDAAASQLVDPAFKPKPVEGRAVDFGRYVLAATQSDNRHSLTPEFAAADHLKLDAPALENLRKSGFTAMHAVPTGRVAAGRTALVSDSGAPLRETTLADAPLTAFQLFAPGGSDYPGTLMGATAHLRQAFLDARHDAAHRRLYRENAERGARNGERGTGNDAEKTEVAEFRAPRSEFRALPVPRPPADPALQELSLVAVGERRGMFLANSRDDIHRALDFCSEQQIVPVLWGAHEAFRCVERLKESGVDLIVSIDFGNEPKVEPPAAANAGQNSDPPAATVRRSILQADVKAPLRVQEDEQRRWKERVGGPARLHAAGLRFALCSHGLKSPAEVAVNVRQAIEAGLPRDAALAALTTNPAAILGVDDRLGTLAPGKSAHVVVMTGPFDHKESKVRYLFVDGHKFEYNDTARPVVDKPDEKPAADVAGKWNVQIESADGKFAAAIELTQSGERLSGEFRSEQGDGKLTSGTLKQDDVNFVVAIGAGSRTVELKFAGKLADGKLAGTLKSAFGAATNWRAERSDPPLKQDKNPVTLTLDAADAKPAAKSAGDPSAAGTLQPTELESDRLARPIKSGGNVLVKNGTVLTGTGQTLPNTSILVRNGKIAAVGPNIEAPEGTTVIDAAGRFVMPGIIDTHSHIKVTDGINEYSLSIVPEVRIKDVINTADASEYRALAGGVTTARILHGSANVIGGQDAVVKLKYGATAREQILDDAPQGVKFALGENVKARTTRFPNTRLGVEATLNRAFMEAIDYRRQWIEYRKLSSQQNGETRSEAGASERRVLPPRRDLRLEALADIVEHQKFIHSHCYRSDEILMLLRVASHLGIRVWSLQHVLEGYKVAPEIVAHGASCSTFADWWAYKVEAFDATPYNVALLNEAGASVVIKSDDWELIRHLYQEAAKPVRYGNVSPGDALAMITLNPARELGLADRIGSIEVGKDGDLAIFSGHPLNSFSRCEQTLIEGEVYFTRAQQPSAMLPEAAANSARPGSLSLASTTIRERPLGLEAAANDKYALVGATLHPVETDDIPRGTLLIDDGKIAALGSDVQVPGDFKTIDADGLHVYPGMIDAGTTLGLVEIRKVTETQDVVESGLFQPDLRAGVAVNPDSELIPVARAGGITSILARPIGGVISGQASLVQLAGWTAPDMVLDYEAGLQIFWPGGAAGKKQIDELGEFLRQGRLYLQSRNASAAEGASGRGGEGADARQADKEAGRGGDKNNNANPQSAIRNPQFAGSPLPTRHSPLITDPRFEALAPYLKGHKPVLIEANSRREIAEALLFADEQKLKVIITGGADAWKLAEQLKERDVPVIVGPVMRKPVEEYDPFDAPYANAGRLHAAGVKFCIRSNSDSNSRNTPFEAAMAVAYGLPEDAALKSVTLWPAEILGVAQRTGSLKAGKTADLVITDGSPLQVTSQVKGVFIGGDPLPPESRQTRFYERYRARLRERGK